MVKHRYDREIVDTLSEDMTPKLRMNVNKTTISYSLHLKELWQSMQNVSDCNIICSFNSLILTTNMLHSLYHTGGKFQ